jgi:2,4-dienoyl-CoA reductase-like NADH-dependent reductase (Old Yellow Enzyme family)
MNETTTTLTPTTTTLGPPLALPNGLVLKNRLAKAAMSEQLGSLSGAPTVNLERLYDRWARGGIGLLITGNVMIDRRSIGEPRNVIAEDDRDRAALERWATTATANDTTAIVQINHPGRQTPAGLSSRVVAPSAIPLSYRGAFPKPRALTHEEILELVERYATTARIVVDAGFHGVQLDGAHGYLISQFLSPRANKRDDEWGGDPERRRRFVLEVARAVREAIGPDRILSVKLNSADFQRGGFAEDESLEVMQLLDAAGVDLLEVSGGTYEAPAMTGTMRQSTMEREAYFLDFAERARAVISAPLMVTGGFRGGAAMQAAIDDGATDLVGLARPLALEPELPTRLLADPAGTRAALHPHNVGIRKLDGAADLYWAQHQLHRLGAGKDPDPHYSAHRALLGLLVHGGVNTIRRKRG